MATRKQFTQSERERRMRHFSKDFKQKIAREIEQKKLSASDVCAEYEVSMTSVNRWLQQFGQSKEKSVRVIVETESDTRKLLELKRRVAELERIIGQKQIQIDFKDKLIELAEEEYGIDIKKKFTEKPLFTSGETEKS
jgi:transposase